MRWRSKTNSSVYRRRSFCLRLLILVIILTVLSVVCLQQLNLRRKMSLLSQLQAETEKVRSENKVLEEEISEADPDRTNDDSERIFSILPK